MARTVEPRAATTKSLVSLKVTLRGTKPPIWRRLLVPGAMTLGALHEALVGPLAPDNLDDDPAKLRDAVQSVTLLALRAVGVMDARARGLVVQAVFPAKTLVGA